MQEVFEKTPDKPKPQQPKQYPTRRTNYGKRKLDENAPITQIKELEDGVRNVVIEGNIFNVETRELKSGAIIFFLAKLRIIVIQLHLRNLFLIKMKLKSYLQLNQELGLKCRGQLLMINIYMM